ncbi:Phytochrome-like protein cph2 [Marinomonas aquimarina]|uniref:diguanylate cyclase n=1 Tax=Marinomonas aquimarina TaxID=295068 RepID=A0A1A8TGI9_9GAMM|nr:GGDEF domain-containing protein [Marinomonas aquimarina]SBS32589.1 Phytochrome-like protein cph2 [Marinomonas aquimarina]
MSTPSLFSVPQLRRLGVRLNIVLLGIILFFLVSSGYGIWTLQQQSEQFKTVTQTYYDRAMLAAELSRDAELIATQAMEQSVTQRLSNIDANILQTDITRTFIVTRSKLSAEAPEEVAALTEIDRLTQPYFDQLVFFYERIENQQRLQLRMGRLNRERQQWVAPYINFDVSADNGPFSAFVLNLSRSTLAMLDAQSPGLLTRRKAQLEEIRTALEGLSGLTQVQQQARQKLLENIAETLELKDQLDQSRLEALAAMRKTRLLAQRLSTVCYDFYLIVKQRANNAAQNHSQLIDWVTLQIALFSLAFLGLIGFTYWLIHHYIVRRLNRLSSVMQQHAVGNPEPIPQQGQDEITVIGKTFAMFVDANDRARDEIQSARKAAEAANERLRELNMSLHLQSNTDDLTQIPNRRSFFDWLNSSYPQWAQQGHGLSILMIDIDWFKSYNDHYGHQAGDQCLRQVAQLLRSVTQQYTGMLARYGGEEFIVAVPGISLAQAAELATTLLATIEQAHIAHGHTPKHHVTISIGVATLSQTSLAYPIEKLISKADQSLYEAKSKGRAQVVSQQVPPSLESSANLSV